jgi:Transposase IS116/IS110/IS902 family/Transposase
VVSRVRDKSDAGASGTLLVAFEHAEQRRDEVAPPGVSDTFAGGGTMERVIERCRGLDVHTKTVAACVRVPGAMGARSQCIRTFGTTAGELLALRDWMEAHDVTDVAMESTGVYWKPIDYVLAERFARLLINASHIAQVPGRETDVQDCVWIASWAGLCPGNNDDAGKQRSGKTRKGNRWLRGTLIQAANAAARTSNTALAARYRRIMRHRRHQNAVVAVAHAMLIAAYHLLTRQVPYQQPGPDYYDHRHVERAKRRAVEALERQGYRVVLEPAA